MCNRSAARCSVQAAPCPRGSPLRCATGGCALALRRRGAGRRVVRDVGAAEVVGEQVMDLDCAGRAVLSALAPAPGSAGARASATYAWMNTTGYAAA